MADFPWSVQSLGAVYALQMHVHLHADPDAELGQVRALLAWFPPQVHRWLLACQWERIAQEEAFVGRAAQVGDDLKTRASARSRLVVASPAISPTPAWTAETGRKSIG